MAEVVAKLRKTRGYVKAKLTRIRTQTSQIIDDKGRLDKEEAETRLERLEEIYREFEHVQQQLLERVDDLSEEDTAEEKAFEQKYFEVKSLLKRFTKVPSEGTESSSTNAIVQLLQQQSEIISQIGRGTQNEVSANSPSIENETLSAILSRQTKILNRVAMNANSTNPDTRVKLPTIKLPRFDGKIEEWKCFSDSFRSIIHDKANLSDIEKFQYLISSISGNAAKIIESIEMTSQNYRTAWELLEQRYDDPKSLKKKHIQCLFSIPVVAKESARILRELIDYTSRHLRVLKVLGLPTDSWDELILHMLKNKVDTRTLRAWGEEIETNDNPRLVDMMEFLKRRCQTIERIESRVIEKTERTNKDGDQRGKGAVVTGTKPNSSARSEVIKKTTLTTALESALFIPDRIKEVKRLWLCLNCLKNDHYIKTCKCGPCRECAKKHNTLCHMSQMERVLPAEPEPSIDSTGSESQSETNNRTIANNVSVHHSSSGGQRRLMATAVVEATQRNGNTIPVRVLLDSASEANFITKHTHNRLGLKCDRVSEVISCLNEIENKIHSSCDVQIKSKHSSFQLNAQCLIVSKITKYLPSVEIDHKKLQIPNNLNLADAEFFKPGAIDMLLGAEYFYDLMDNGKIELGEHQLILQNTKLGWIIAGSMQSDTSKNQVCNLNSLRVMICSLNPEESLNNNLEKFWKLEGYDDEKQITSVDEKRCEKLFEQTTARSSDGRFIVRLPFREGNKPIGNNRGIALKRLNQLERKFKGDNTFHDRYINFMQEYVKLGHMSIANEPIIDSENIVYLPHHEVVKE
ncbi:uncharacterized protein LOC105202500 [Solenopsis invicta]|uniref:uncharacterized protein LOC105202500 n=1 Tax=Solenopsis invicta TaxID=13686 RepID=UPI00193CFBD8|nr:uncharacterized protein LOC105202500 [Solenopsis invicta]